MMFRNWLDILTSKSLSSFTMLRISLLNSQTFDINYYNLYYTCEHPWSIFLTFYRFICLLFLMLYRSYLSSDKQDVMISFYPTNSFRFCDFKNTLLIAFWIISLTAYVYLSKSAISNGELIWCSRSHLTIALWLLFWRIPTISFLTTR